MLMNRIKKICIFFICLLSCSLTLANQASKQMKVSASVQAACSIVALSINFDEVTPQRNGLLKLKSKIKTICTKNTAYQIAFTHGAPEVKTRYLKSTNPLNKNDVLYNLYKDESLTEILGDGTNNTHVLKGLGSGQSQEISFFGSLNLNQFVKADNYTDEIIISINY